VRARVVVHLRGPLTCEWHCQQPARCTVVVVVAVVVAAAAVVWRPCFGDLVPRAAVLS